MIVIKSVFHVKGSASGACGFSEWIAADTVDAALALARDHGLLFFESITKMDRPVVVRDGEGFPDTEHSSEDPSP